MGLKEKLESLSHSQIWEIWEIWNSKETSDKNEMIRELLDLIFYNEELKADLLSDVEKVCSAGPIIETIYRKHGKETCSASDNILNSDGVCCVNCGIQVIEHKAK
jgi:hypothetical protein